MYSMSSFSQLTESKNRARERCPPRPYHLNNNCFREGVGRPRSGAFFRLKSFPKNTLKILFSKIDRPQPFEKQPTPADVAKKLKVSVPTLYRYLPGGRAGAVERP